MCIRDRAYCEIVGDQLKLTGLYGNEEGSKLVIKTLEGSIESPIDLGVELAQLVLKEYENYEGDVYKRQRELLLRNSAK